MNVRKRICNASPLPNDASSILRHVARFGLLFTAAASAGQGQDTLRAKVDSLAARVERAEEQVRMLQQAIVTEAQSAVRTRSRIAMEFRGHVLVNAFTNSRRVNNTDNPLFVRPDDSADPFPRGLAMQIRQTALGFAVSATDVAGANFTGDLDVDFYGGQQPSSGGRTFPLVRMRTARAVLEWPHAEVLLGQESPLIAGVNPVSLASLGTPGFTAAGNLWLWIPQARVGIETGGPIRVGVQGAVLAPATGAAVSSFDVPDFDAAERSKRPFLEARARARWGADEMPAEVGVGAHAGWFAMADDSLAKGTIVSADALVPVTRWLEVRGEFYQGRGARALGGGGIGQLFGTDGVLLHSRGAWAQLNVKPNASFIVGAGYGTDDPDDEELGANARLKNTVTSAHIDWRPSGPLVFGIEYRQARTRYATGSFVNDHLNVALGFEF